MIKCDRDQTNGDFLIIDTSTNEVRRFGDQPSWLYASLVELLRGNERIEAGLADLQAMYERPVPYIATPEKAAELLGGHPRGYDGLFREPGPSVYVCRPRDEATP